MAKRGKLKSLFFLAWFPALFGIAHWDWVRVRIAVARLALLSDYEGQAIHACATLSQILTPGGSTLQNWAGNAGSIEAAVAAMRKHNDSIVAQMFCSDVLEKTALFNRAQSLAVQRAGGIEQVIAMLRRWPNDRHVQSRTSTLSSFNDYVPESRPIILHKGGLDIIYAAMRNFYNDTEVLFRTGCAISATSGDKEVVRWMLEEERVTFLMKQMRDKVGAWRVGQEIMQATRNMLVALKDEAKSALVQRGLVKNIVDTIAAELHERGTPAIGGTNIALLAVGDFAMQEEFAALGAFEILIEALFRYAAPDNQNFGGTTVSDVWPVVPTVGQALWALTHKHPANLEKLRSLGGVELLTWLVRSNKRDGRIFYSCDTLGKLTGREAKRLPVLAADPELNEVCAKLLLGEPKGSEEEFLRHIGSW